ncbi:MAG TPA: PEP/pyruvate-binding domain-containing protein, partial [Burkholderiales bacterium]|nr:PEP/pyruvate-binding domain-containing protein [Burkholderiales bacterium]
MNDEPYVVGFENLRMNDVGRVGGKNASLGEMIGQLGGGGVRVPGGFATTAHAYRDFLAHDGLKKRIEAALTTLNVDDVAALAKSGAEIRQWIIAQPLPARLEREIAHAYQQMLTAAGSGISVAVRSSATAEDLPDASFAGQQETFLNIDGVENVLAAVKHVFASLYNDRAISYRVHKGFIHSEVALSAGV